jgi:hypothetical protein
MHHLLRLALLGCLLGPLTLEAAELTTATGKKLTGDLIRLDSKSVTLKTAGGEVTTPINEVLTIDFKSPAVPPPGPDARWDDIELIDGSVLHCKTFAVKGPFIEATVWPDRQLKLPLVQIFSVLRDAQDTSYRKQWQSILTRRVDSDLYVFKKKTEQGVLDTLAGTIVEGDPEGVSLKLVKASDGRVISPKQANMFGLVFVQKTGEIPRRLCKLVDAHRNVLSVRSLSVEPGKITVTTVAGLAVEYPDFDSLGKLDFSDGRLVYLSDLEPISKQEASFDERLEYVRMNRSVNNQPIRLDGQTYEKGIAAFAETILTYNLGGDYRELKCVVGVDEAASPDSEVLLIIEGDGRELFKQTVKARDKARPLTLDVRGVQQLRLAILSPGDFDFGNQVTIADARVTK